MTKQTTKAQLLKDISIERLKLERTVASLSASELLQPGVVGVWTVKDLLAHLAAWEKLFLDWYRAGQTGTAPAIQPPGRSRKAIDALNEQIFEQYRFRGLAEIRAEFDNIHADLMKALGEVSEEDLFIHGRLTWTGNLTLADYLAANTCNHFAWATAKIREWIKRNQS